MHNIRKIKRKKKAKIINPEELAQQKLFEISRFQDEEDRFNQVDLFIEKLQPKIKKSESQLPNKQKIKVHNRTLAHFYDNQADKYQRRIQEFAFASEIHSHSSQIIGKKPIQLINYVLFDRRQRIGQKNINKSRVDSLAKIKRKMNLKKSKSVQQQRTQQQNVEKSLETKKGDALLNWKLSKKSEPPFQIKNMKLFNKYVSVLPAMIS